MKRGAVEETKTAPLSLLMSYGVPRQLIYAEQPQKSVFNSLIESYSYERDNGKPVFIDLKTQKENLAKLLDPDVFDTAILCGTQTDAMVKFLALRIATYYVSQNKIIKWHTLYPTFKFATPDLEEYPQLLIIANAFVDSTAGLWDQLRAMVDLYHCPKIILSAGVTPHELMKKAHKAAQIGIYLK